MAKLVTMHGLSRELNMSRESLRRWVDEGLITLPSRFGHGPGVFTEREVAEIRRTIVARRLGRPLPIPRAPRVRG